ncbi:lipoprotein [Streptomyces sp. MUM 178J]|uniref:lipoprotein n=1 Tax=Streptomyces sp. MUM 178J TaxID=2791991 RepID=UPI001F037EC5|nr:lipoprotein [Streptomyces sp. MUM 178J]WRQ82150.1 lipoprotein [Streptomyces sp. MUM 178J]
MRSERRAGERRDRRAWAPRGTGAGLAAVVLAAGVLSGCSGKSGADKARTMEPGVTAEPEGTTEKSEATGGAGAASSPAARTRSVGAPDTACELPVAFDLAASWEPEAVKLDTEFGALTHGPVTLVCEIDAKPAGNIGFLRVWTAGDDEGGGDARAALEAFVAEEAQSRDAVAFTETQAGGFPAAEVGYLNTSEFLDGPKKERALAVSAPGGLVVLHLGGLDTEEHEAMLPAYELAKKTLRAASAG